MSFLSLNKKWPYLSKIISIIINNGRRCQLEMYIYRPSLTVRLSEYCLKGFLEPFGCCHYFWKEL
jgi:hypothetical protein